MSLTSLLRQTITLYTKSGYDKFGRETVGTGSNYRCRFQKTTKARLTPTGEQVTISGIVYLDDSVSIAIDDKVTFDSVDYKVFSVNTAVEGRGNTHHQKIELIKWQET